MSDMRYTDEFKSEAAKQVIEYGRSAREVAGRLGISIDCKRLTNHTLDVPR
jgi:transposase